MATAVARVEAAGKNIHDTLRLCRIASLTPIRQGHASRRHRFGPRASPPAQWKSPQTPPSHLPTVGVFPVLTLLGRFCCTRCCKGPRLRPLRDSHPADAKPCFPGENDRFATRTIPYGAPYIDCNPPSPVRIRAAPLLLTLCGELLPALTLTLSRRERGRWVRSSGIVS